MQASLGKIDELHRKLSEAATARLGYDVVIRPDRDYEDWTEITDEPIGFAIFDDDCGDWATAGHAEHSYCPVVALAADYETRFSEVLPRLAWWDRWQCSGEGYSLLGAGWSLYWGHYGRDNYKRLLVRAEWENIALQGATAAQPHWHLHVSEEEYSVEDDSRVKKGPRAFNRAHLGMGGWEHGEIYPECWQLYTSEASIDGLLKWADRILECILLELRQASLL